MGFKLFKKLGVVNPLNIRVLFTALVGFLPVVAFALGIGPIHLRSSLNQPLMAIIPLNEMGDLDETQIKIRLADNSFFTKAGLYRSPWLSELKFKVIKQTDNKGEIHILSKNPIKDPVIDLLLNVSWPSGKVIRQYTILLDPQEPSLQSAQARTVIPRDFASQPQNNTKKVAYGNNAQASTQAKFGGQYGPIKDEDTLWQIANQLVSNSQYSVSQGVVAIYQKNPNAFEGDNMNQITLGTMLVLPTEAELNAISAEDARAQIKQQSQMATAKKTNQFSPQNAISTHPLENKPLKILSAQNEAVSAKKKPSEKYRLEDSETQIELVDRISMLEEALDTLKRRNEDVNQQNAHLKKNYDRLFDDLSEKEKQLKQLKEGQPQDAIVAKQQPPIEPNEPVNEIDEPTAEVTKTATVNMPAPKTLPTAPQSTPKADLSLPNKLGALPSVDSPFILGKNTWIFSLLAALVLAASGAGFYIWQRRMQSEAAFSLDSDAKTFTTSEKKIQKQSAPHAVAEKSAQHEQSGTKQDSDIVNYGLDIDLDKALTEVKLENKSSAALHSEEALNAKFDFEAVKRKFSEELEEAEVAIAYEHYHKAEEILIEILGKAPNHWLALLKLLELYTLTENHEQFMHWKDQVPKTLHEVDMEIWSKIEFLVEKFEQEAIETPDIASIDPDAKPQASQAQDISLEPAPKDEALKEDSGVEIAEYDMQPTVQDSAAEDLITEDTLEESQSLEMTQHMSSPTSEIEILPDEQDEADIMMDMPAVEEKAESEPTELELEDPMSSVEETGVDVTLEQQSIDALEQITKAETGHSNLATEELEIQAPAKFELEEQNDDIQSSDSEVSTFEATAPEQDKPSFIHLNRLGEDTQSLIELAKAFIGAKEYDSAKGLLEMLIDKADPKQSNEIKSLLESIG